MKEEMKTKALASLNRILDVYGLETFEAVSLLAECEGVFKEEAAILKRVATELEDVAFKEDVEI